MITDLKPQGTMEELLAEDVITTAWRLRRIPIAEKKILDKILNLPEIAVDEDDGDQDKRLPLDQFGSFIEKVTTKLYRYSNSIEKQFDRSLKRLKEAQATRLKREK